MGYLPEEESRTRVDRVRKIMESRDLDIALVYYDEFNIGNGWYLTGWCPQFESGAVMVPRTGDPLILGGPESEPFAKLDSSIKETRNFTVFMVPDEEYPNATITDFPALHGELGKKLGEIRRVGLVGGDRMPAECFAQMEAGFGGVELVDITDEYVSLRFVKSRWERDQIRAAFALADSCYDAMKAAVAPGVSEIRVAAEGEYAARRGGASGFGFTAIVGSGPRSSAVVPTASSRIMEEGEMAMIGLSPKVNGYCGVIGDALPVSGSYSESQEQCMAHLRHAFRLTREQLHPGRTGREIDAPARTYFEKEGLSRYLVCPFAHTIGLHEAESPFFGPGSDDELLPGMTVCIDVSFFGHPEWHGVRIETGYEITSDGAVPLSPKLDEIHSSE
jgi:Xaa-Pro aminopeptidase